jgi:hypothetical protein
MLVAALVPAAAALGAALLAQPLGRGAAFVAASIAGTFGVLFSSRWLGARGWTDPARHRGSAIGGLVGLGLASALASTGPLQPLLVVAGAALIALGTMVGAGPGAAR